MKGNDDIHQRLTRGRARFKHGGAIDGAMSLPSMLHVYLIHWYKPLWYNKFTCSCRFWSLVFMQGFSVESKTSGH
jgi:hypothetical protein